MMNLFKKTILFVISAYVVYLNYSNSTYFLNINIKNILSISLGRYWKFLPIFILPNFIPFKWSRFKKIVFRLGFVLICMRTNLLDAYALNRTIFNRDIRLVLMIYFLPITTFLISLWRFYRSKSNKTTLYLFISSFFLSTIVYFDIFTKNSRINILNDLFYISLNGKSGGLLAAIFTSIVTIIFNFRWSLTILNSSLLVIAMYLVLDFSIKLYFKIKGRNRRKLEIKNLKDNSSFNENIENNEEDNRNNNFLRSFDSGKKTIDDLSREKAKKLALNNTTNATPKFGSSSVNNININKISSNLNAIEKSRSYNPLDKIFSIKPQNRDNILNIKKEVADKSLALENMLKQYGIEAKVINTFVGPSITRFELSVPTGIRVKKVSSLSDDIAMNLEAESVRIEAPIPGKNAVGVEIPNDTRSEVPFANLIRKKEKSNHLQFVLGKNIIGEDILVDLKKMPHLLVAGRTGAGKSVGINVIISSILYTASPEDVRFIMIDPKMVELMPYNDIPHLYVPVITDPKLAANALNWTVQEMERRYQLLANIGVRNLVSYNDRVKDKLPYIVVVIDELADLMMVAPGTIEESIARIAQKARAVGIHLVIATQRPSIDVVTGTIKANLPSRISFAVTSQIDSRTILDSQGAEKLLGRGDMLFLNASSPNLMRIQGANISDREIDEFVKYLKSKGGPQYDESILESAEESDKDDLYDKALSIMKTENRISTTLIQRKLKVGYSRAARIIDQMEAEGLVRIGTNGEKELISE
jgi:hypothetical protein